MGGTKGKEGGGGSGQDPVAIIVSRKYAQTLYKILPRVAAIPPGLFHAVAVALGLPASLPKKKNKKGGGKKYYPGGKPPTGGKPHGGKPPGKP